MFALNRKNENKKVLKAKLYNVRKLKGFIFFKELRCICVEHK